MSETGTCVGCGSSLQDGFIEDSGDSVGYLRWIPGALEKGVFGGARRFLKERVDIHAYRCTGCGLLSLYAGGTPFDTEAQRSRMARYRRQHGGVDAPGAVDQEGLTPPSPSPFGDG